MKRAATISATTPEPTPEVDATGTKRWKVDGELHREGGPAVEFANGEKHWYRHGRHHRDDGPAIEWPNGNTTWYRYGQRHREDGPAIEWANGSSAWFLNGQQYTKPRWLCEVLKDRPLTSRQRELLHALSENWAGTPDVLYETVTNLAG